MKIVIVTDAWRPQINGVVNTYLHTAEQLRRRGYEVTLITPNQFSTIPCPTYPEIKLSFTSPRRLFTLLAAAAPHAVHLATEGPLGWAARGACRKVGFGFTTTYHTRFPEYIRVRFPIPLSFTYWVVRTFHNGATRTMAATSELREELNSRGFKNVVPWARGVDTEMFRPCRSPDVQNEEPIFTYMGRVAPEKNIEAFLQLDLPGRKCVIGDGPARAELRRMYPDAHFAGYRQGKELARLLAASAVFVFPSRTDTFGVVQLEAMACGVPVAAYPASGPRELIENGVNGWMDEDLRTAVLKCLDIDRSRCRAYAEKFSWQASTEQFLANLEFSQTPFPG